MLVPRGDAIDSWSGIKRIGAPHLAYADSLGHIYGASMLRPPQIDKRTGRRDPRTVSILDTIPVIAFHLAEPRIETLATYDLGIPVIPPVRHADGSRTEAVLLGPYGASNGWLATRDGKVITADASTYTLTIRTVRDTAAVSWRIPANPVPVSESSWIAYVAKTTRGSAALIDSVSRQVLASVGANPPRIPGTQYTVPPMPKVLPLINFGHGGQAMVEHNGVLWVRVHRSDPPKPVYWDQIDLATRKRIGTLVLPENQHLLDVTSLGAYVLAVDDDDLQRVLLYRRPG